MNCLFLNAQPSSRFFFRSPFCLFLIPFCLLSSSLPSFLSLSPPRGLHCYISNVNNFLFVISPSSSLALSSPSPALLSIFPRVKSLPLFLVSVFSSSLTPSFASLPLLSSQWAEPPETPVLFVAAERGMGNDVAFSSVADRQTDRGIAGNLQLPLAIPKTHTHKHTHWGMMGKGMCMCPNTHNPFGGCKSSFLQSIYSITAAACGSVQKACKNLKINKF